MKKGPKSGQRRIVRALRAKLGIEGQRDMAAFLGATLQEVMGWELPESDGGFRPMPEVVRRLMLLAVNPKALPKVRREGQQERLRAAARRFGLSYWVLSETLGYSKGSIYSWLAPVTARSYSALPRPASMLLDELMRRNNFLAKEKFSELAKMARAQRLTEKHRVRLLNRVRDLLGVTSRQLSDRLGVSAGTVKAWRDPRRGMRKHTVLHLLILEAEANAKRSRA